VDDPRPDSLLEECGRLYWRIGAALAWTDGIRNDVEAKACSRRGQGSWKAAKPLSEQVGTEEAAAGYFKERARKRNPAVTASGSGFDLVEYDGDRNRLDRELGIPRLPPTLGWRSRRGPHLIYRAPEGEAPIKVQIDPEGVTLIGDGYLVAAPAWRAEHGVVYELNGTMEPVRLPAELRLVLQEYGRETRSETRRRFAEGEPIPKGHRDIAIFWKAVDLLRNGLSQEDALGRTLEVNREQCRPPLSDELVRKQFRGAVKFVIEHPTETELARVEARRVLREFKVAASRARGEKSPNTGSADEGFFDLISPRARERTEPKLDVAALHGPAGAWAIACQPYTEASAAGVLVATLVAAGNAIGRSPSLEIGGTRHHVNEYALLVGPTGTGRKGDAMNLGRRPVADADVVWRGRVHGGFGSGEAVVFEVRDPQYARDEKGNEKLVDEGASDKRLLVLEAEFGHVIAVAAREGSTLSALLRAGWDGSEPLANRTKRSRIIATNAHVSALAAITAEELVRNLPETEAANGFLNRFLLAYVERSKLLPSPQPIPLDLDAEHRRRFAEVLAAAGKIRRLARARDAEELWREAYASKLAVERRGLVGAVCSRAEAHVLRLSMLYALLDGSAEIRPEHVQAALALWDYCEASAEQVFGKRLGDPDADAIVVALAEAGADGLTRTEVCSLFGRRHYSRIAMALARLLEQGLVVSWKRQTEGRPQQRFRLAQFSEERKGETA
jgi:Protein of unknown function (DUF3987)